MQLLSAAILVSSLNLLCQVATVPTIVKTPDSPSVQLKQDSSSNKGGVEYSTENGDFKDFEDREEVEDEDEEEEEDFFKINDLMTNVESLTHVHRKGGEILVPCFGMWWPVGSAPARPAPPVYYEYGVEYYDDYGKKRRRAKKRRAKKAKMKKRKKA